MKISELEGCVSNKDLGIEKCLERLNDCKNKLHKIEQMNQTIHMIMPSKDNLYNGRKGIDFENPSYFEKAQDLRHSLYNEKVIGLGYTLMFLTHLDEALEIKRDFVHFSDLDTFSSVRRAKHSGVIWKKKKSSNNSIVDLSSISHSKLNKDVKRYTRKDLLSCNNSHVADTSSVFLFNNAINVSCNSRLYDSFDENNLFIFDDESYMMGNRALLTNFVEKFLGTVRFGNNIFAVITGNGDVVIGSMTIKNVYYVKGLGHTLFSVGELCDKGLEVSFLKSTCFVRNEDGVDLLTSDRSSNLYTISLNEVASNSSTYLLAKASSSQSWLWH
nr:retrovirus-related Pol polyprotein from transposon TNT 1-94 [Tanacetum cinerariifolium]